MTFQNDLSPIIAGEDEDYRLRFKVNGNEKDVSGYSFRMKIANEQRDDVVLEGDNVDTSNAVNGEVLIELPASESKTLKEGNRHYKIHGYGRDWRGQRNSHGRAARSEGVNGRRNHSPHKRGDRA